MNEALYSELLLKSCVQLPPGSPALSGAEVQRLGTAVPDWVLGESSITREYRLPTYMDGVRWFALLAAICEQENHHPEAVITWRRVKINFWTHTVKGISENDFILAAKLERAWHAFRGSSAS